MDQRQKELNTIEQILESLKEVTFNFTIDNYVCLSDRSASPYNKILDLGNDFKGFGTVNPESHLNVMLAERYKAYVRGYIVYHPVDKVVSYNLRRWRPN